MMYEIKNGILYKNGKKLYALGESYYPSFHPLKFPVPPEGNRMGEMKKDLRMMAEVGFNHVRFAALGEVGLDGDGTLSVDTPFVDAMVEEAKQNGLSVSIRQQGFAVNLRGFDGVKMIDWNGAPQETAWSDFIRTTLHHEGIWRITVPMPRDLPSITRSSTIWSRIRSMTVPKPPISKTVSTSTVSSSG